MLRKRIDARTVRPRLALVACAAFFASSAIADGAPSAREHFDRGVELAKREEFFAAALEFEAAYRMKPNDAVFYNLGQAYVALGNPVEALAALEAYLASKQTKLTEARRREVQAIISSQRRMVGALTLSVEPAGSEVSLDGRVIGQSPFSTPVSVSAGVHGLVIKHPDYEPFIGHVDIEPRKAVQMEVSLTRRPVQDAATAPVGQLAIRSSVPGIAVSVDGKIARWDSQSPMLITVGAHHVVCHRMGYTPFDHQVDVLERSLASVDCNLAPQPNLGPSEAGTVTVDLPQGAELLIDGRRSGSLARLPTGMHTVLVRHLGFDDWRRNIVITAGLPQAVKPVLRPTRQHQETLAAQARSRRSWAYLVGGTGLALLGPGVLLYVDDNHRYSKWASERDALSRDLNAQTSGARVSERAGRLQNSAVSIQRQDDIAVGLGVLGVAALSCGIVTWLGAQ